MNNMDEDYKKATPEIQCSDIQKNQKKPVCIRKGRGKYGMRLCRINKKEKTRYILN